jgi:hemoglobin-like flavoprotein
MRNLDGVDLLAILLLVAGAGMMFWGIHLQPPTSFNELFVAHFGDWTPGFFIDGILLLVLNRVIHSHERNRVINQVASLSNEFALDAIRRCRSEGWLHDGTMEGGQYSKARLATADCSDANLNKADLSFSDLTQADFTHALLRESNLTGANLSGCDLRWSDLSDCDLSWADLRGAQLDGATLAGAKTSFAFIDPEHQGLAAFKGAMVGGFLTTQQVGLVQEGFSQLLTRGDAPIIRFYENLFETAPELQSLFSGDMERQARKFLQSLKVIVSGLTATEKAAPVLQRLGERHRGYGVESSHYDIVGGVLVSTLAETLGDDFSEDMREAWDAAFQLIAALMRTGSS